MKIAKARGVYNRRYARLNAKETRRIRSTDLGQIASSWLQGSSGGTSSADEFLDAALRWFGDPDPRLGTAWEKGERLAKLVAHRRTLLVLDGLEPLQNPPGPQEGRLREPSLQALLRELVAFNKGLCVITTRTPFVDIADRQTTSALRPDPPESRPLYLLRILFNSAFRSIVPNTPSTRITAALSPAAKTRTTRLWDLSAKDPGNSQFLSVTEPQVFVIAN